LAGFTLISGNRMEWLARELAAHIKIRTGDSLAPELIVIQSRGMERWLALEIARHNGIAANLDFPFPDAFLRRILDAALPDTVSESFFDREVMTFGIYALLADLAAADPAFNVIQRYLRHDTGGLKRFQLAEQIARLFDQYLVFRPDMILRWDEGQLAGENPHERWQAVLWQALRQRLPGKSHRAHLWRRMLASLQRGDVSDGTLPQRVSVFGISYLPPFYLQALSALSSLMAVDFYQLNPCREFWADIVSRDEEKRWRRSWRNTGGVGTEADLHLEEGNRLLASMGNQGRAFHRLAGDFDIQTEELFQDGDSRSLLAAIQDDILNLRHPSAEDERTAPSTAGDHSLQIHACHGPMREIEILHDHLLNMLDTDPRLEPRDILVLTTDMETYAPYIQAVFGTPEDESQRLPFSLADRGVIQNRPVVDAFFLLLDLPQSRFPASEIAGLLEVASLRARFGFADEDVALIGDWISETRIRWGTDAAAKSRLGLPPEEANTWQAGLDRLIMGYAVASDDGPLCHGILPSAGAEGTAADVLGHLVVLMARMKDWQQRLSAPMRATKWARCLLRLLDGFFESDPTHEPDLRWLRRLINEMPQYAEEAAMDDPMGIEVVRAYLRRRIEDQRSGAGFVSGGITFAALLPMRSIPAKVVCLLGMGQDLFPREDRPLGFDLMAAKPHLGDRSRRSDDKYLFLEALISARQCFYVSFVGYDVQDNTILPPSVLVSELIDYITEGYRVKEEDLVTRHRLQAFSPAYFQTTDQRFFSYSQTARDAAARLVATRSQPQVPRDFIASPLPPWDAGFLTVDLDSLSQALGHACRFMMEKRLQIRLHDRAVDTNDRESFTLDPLGRFDLGQTLAREFLQASDMPDAMAKAKARGQIPHGDPGRKAFKDVWGEVADWIAVIQEIQQGALPARVTVDRQVPPYTITGTLDTLFPGGQLCYRFSRAKGTDLIGAWLRHLLWDDPFDRDGNRPTVLATRDGLWRFRPVDHPDEHLQALLAIYQRIGHEPVPLFPRTSWNYAVMRFEKHFTTERALERVRAQWPTTYRYPGEADDPYIRYCFPHGNPLGETFVKVTEAVYDPIMQFAERIH